MASWSQNTFASLCMYMCAASHAVAHIRMHAQPSPGQSENYGCDKASKNVLPSDSNFVFQIRRIWMQICQRSQLVMLS